MALAAHLITVDVRLRDIGHRRAVRGVELQTPDLLVMEQGPRVTEFLVVERLRLHDMPVVIHVLMPVLNLLDGSQMRLHFIYHILVRILDFVVVFHFVIEPFLKLVLAQVTLQIELL